MATKLSEKPTPTGLFRWAVRLPIWLYRARLGFLLGGRFLLLEHRGRKSGATRFTVLEVVHHDGAGYVIASGWGEKAQWFRNVMHTPRVAFTVGLERRQTEAVRLPLDEATALLTGYSERNPGAFKGLARFMLGEKVQPGPQGAAQLAAAVPLLRLPTP